MKIIRYMLNLDLDFYQDGTEWRVFYKISLFLILKLPAPIQEY